MLLFLTVSLAGIAIMSTIFGMRALDAWAWPRSLVALRLKLPASLSVDDASRFLDVIAGMTQPPKWSLLPYPPIGLEIVADHYAVTHYVFAPKALEPKLMSILRAGLPGVRIESAADYLTKRPALRLAAELKATSVLRPLGESRAETASAAL